MAGDNKIDGDLSATEWPMLNFFFQQYPPATDFKTADLTLSTEEIRQNIGDHSGQYFEVTDLYNWLLTKGYRQDTLGEGKFIWLLKDGEKF